jgi:hypothetical protein
MNFGLSRGTGIINLGTRWAGFDYTLTLNPTNLTLTRQQRQDTTTGTMDPVLAGIQDGDGTWFTGPPATSLTTPRSENENWANSFSNSVDSRQHRRRVRLDQCRGTGEEDHVRAAVHAHGARNDSPAGDHGNADATVSANVVMNAAQSFSVASTKTLTVSATWVRQPPAPR